MITSALMSPLARRPVRWISIAGACVFGCASSGFDGHVFRDGDLAFRVGDVPPEWRRIETDGPLLAFRDDTTPASVAVNARCGKDGDDVPLEALTHHLFLEFTDRVLENETRVEMDGREALHTELLAKLDGVEKRFAVFVFKKNGCVYDFVHIAPPEAPADGRRRFVAFVEGFSTIKP
jgi:hypothetical protein